jgi:hypothetical protein
MEFETLTLLVMIPGMHHGHLISLLRNIRGSGFFDHDIPALRAINDRLIAEASVHFGPMDTFASGPLLGTFIRAQPPHIQARNVAAQLHIAYEPEQRILDDNNHPVLERIFNPFIIDTYARSEVMDAVDMVGSNPITAKAFFDIYHGMTAVLILE